MTASEPTLDSASELLLATVGLTLLLLVLLLLRNRRSWCATFGFGEEREFWPMCIRISAGLESHGMGRCDRSCLQKFQRRDCELLPDTYAGWTRDHQLTLARHVYQVQL